MKNTIYQVEGIFGDIIGEDSFSQEEITKPKKCLAKIM